jgi:hypothetical protein
MKRLTRICVFVQHLTEVWYITRCRLRSLQAHGYLESRCFIRDRAFCRHKLSRRRICGLSVDQLNRSCLLLHPFCRLLVEFEQKDRGKESNRVIFQEEVELKLRAQDSISSTSCWGYDVVRQVSNLVVLTRSPATFCASSCDSGLDCVIKQVMPRQFI